MKLRHAYVVAGGAWALLLAPIAAFAVSGAVAGALWLWVYGDGPWSPATDWAIPAIGLLAGLAVAAGCIGVARAIGRQREARLPPPGRAEWRRVALLAIAPVIVAALLAAASWQRAAQEARAEAAAAQRQAAFDALLAERHRIDGLEVALTGDGTVRAQVRSSGGRGGRYTLRWQVSSAAYGPVLSGTKPDMPLPAGPGTLDVSLSVRDLARGYAAALLQGRGAALVDERFALSVTLEPVIDDEQRAAWPPAERRLWDLGETPLRSRASASFPVRFRVREDGTIAPASP